MNKEKALALLGSFPELSEGIRKQIDRAFPIYLIADRKRKIMCCSSCGGISPDSPKTPQREKISCPKCGKNAAYIKNRYDYCAPVNRRYFTVFLNNPQDENLYIRCFAARLFFQKGEMKPLIELDEIQRYVFSEKIAARYGRDHYWDKTDGYWWHKKYREEWTVRTRLTEPVFEDVKQEYTVINAKCVKYTCMRHSQLEKLKFGYPMLPIDYLNFYRTHRGCERLIKCGLEDLVRQQFTRYGGYTEINWKETEPHKMLGVNREAFRAIREKRIEIRDYKRIYKFREDYLKYTYKNLVMEIISSEKIIFNRVFEHLEVEISFRF